MGAATVSTVVGVEVRVEIRWAVVVSCRVGFLRIHLPVNGWEDHRFQTPIVLLDTCIQRSRGGGEQQVRATADGLIVWVLLRSFVGRSAHRCGHFCADMWVLLRTWPSCLCVVWVLLRSMTCDN